MIAPANARGGGGGVVPEVGISRDERMKKKKEEE
jgi:hypothetical protein